MTSIATVPSAPAKIQYTTGAVTVKNYIQRKAGLKAEFDHVYGALLVEVSPEGRWFVRQLATDENGEIYDISGCGVLVFGEGYTRIDTESVCAVVWGDAHERYLPETTRQMCWGADGIVDTLNPDHQVFHDVLDFESRGHHTRRDPYKMFSLRTKSMDTVADECIGVAELFRRAWRPGTSLVVVKSNHDEHLDRWLRETDWRDDIHNALFHAKIHLAKLTSITKSADWNALQWVVNNHLFEIGDTSTMDSIVWLQRGTSFVVCPDEHGGIELSLHGDGGPNGAKGNVRNLAALGRKVVIGHGHGAHIFGGAWQVGVLASGMEYAEGTPNNWSNTFCVVHQNGKRQMITAVDNEWVVK